MNNTKSAALFLLSLFCCLLAANKVQAQAATPVDSTYINAHYNERLAQFEKMPHRKKAIVFVGNSITEAGKWADILPGKPVQNRGISGDVTFGVLARLPHIIKAKPAKLFLMIGVNDLKREVPVPLIIENYKRMVAMVRKGSPHTKIYLQTVLPVNDSLLIESFRKVTNQNVKKLNDALQVLAQQKRVYYVNLHPVFADASGQLKAQHTPDGLHLTVASYTAWVAYLQQMKFL